MSARRTAKQDVSARGKPTALAKPARSPDKPARRTSAAADDPADGQALDLQTSMPREPGTRIGFLVHDVSRMRRTLYDQAVKPLGLTRSQWWVLAQLSRQKMPDGMLQTELANVLDVGKVTIGGLVDRLEERGFVLRTPDREDRRAKRVRVTPEGRKVLKQMVRLSGQLNSTIFAGFSDEEVQTAETFLDRMKSNIRSALER